ncbi:hypothetical protein EB796_009140 [Bugula neritina]|uniref:Uncharacterized protein n=1 Tax=Bugula neritina TaxID=10212 RepID=A0A7J7K1N3_BUGNE|nr:hypothetical protein EB796_009140 [Bugula neritina]
MKDLWAMLRENYDLIDQPEDDICECLKDTKSNGIYEAVDWVARHYKHGTPITLLNRPIPKLTDAKTWGVWKYRLLHYYDSQAISDAVTYLRCVLD